MGRIVPFHFNYVKGYGRKVSFRNSLVSPAYKSFPKIAYKEFKIKRSNKKSEIFAFLPLKAKSDI